MDCPEDHWFIVARRVRPVFDAAVRDGGGDYGHLERRHSQSGMLTDRRLRNLRLSEQKVRQYTGILARGILAEL